MLALLRTLNPYLIAIALLGAALVVQTLRLSWVNQELSETHRLHAVAHAQLMQVAQDAEASARANEARMYREIQEVANEAQNELDKARLDAAAADAAADRLQHRVEELSTRCNSATKPPAATGPGEAAGTPADMLPFVFSRIDQAAGAIAEHAVRARVAGLTCENAYDKAREALGAENLGTEALGAENLGVSDKLR